MTRKIIARDLMISIDAVASAGLASSLQEARSTNPGKEVLLVRDEAGRPVGVASTKTLHHTRRMDIRLHEVMPTLLPVALTHPDASGEELYAALQEYEDLWHAVFEEGELVGLVSPMQLAMASELFGPTQLSRSCYCCQATPPHCFSLKQARDRNLALNSPCPEDDGTPLSLLNPCPRR